MPVPVNVPVKVLAVFVAETLPLKVVPALKVLVPLNVFVRLSSGTLVLN